ncbi:MAG: hypothetical protein JWO40_345 [Candidatus Doudnabacteria bacterium]|nr:hypothetical protein [Candidatus Doudnabacteria bacterium]
MPKCLGNIKKGKIMFNILDGVGHELKEDAKDAAHDTSHAAKEAGEWTKEKANNAAEDVRKSV